MTTETNKVFFPTISYLNIAIFAFLTLVTVLGIGRGGLQVIKVTFIPLIVSGFIVFGKKNSITFTADRLILKKQFLGMFFLKDLEISYSQIKKIEVWSMAGAKRVTISSDAQELYILKSGDIGSSTFEAIVDELKTHQ
jgi:hypothetical protein